MYRYSFGNPLFGLERILPLYLISTTLIESVLDFYIRKCVYEKLGVRDDVKETLCVCVCGFLVFSWSCVLFRWVEKRKISIASRPLAQSREYQENRNKNKQDLIFFFFFLSFLFWLEYIWKMCAANTRVLENSICFSLSQKAVRWWRSSVTPAAVFFLNAEHERTSSEGNDKATSLVITRFPLSLPWLSSFVFFPDFIHYVPNDKLSDSFIFGNVFFLLVSQLFREKMKD